mgnify:CR=1 FL=1
MSHESGERPLIYDVEISGKALTLNNVSVFPQFADEFSLGTVEPRSMLRQIAGQAKEAGFETLTLRGLRIGGANPGRIAEITVDLTRF